MTRENMHRDYFLLFSWPMPALYSFARTVVAIFVGVATILITGTILAPGLIILDDYYPTHVHDTTNDWILYTFGFFY
ncbi:MAG TPA: hypothetical protein VHM26_05060, partial [Chitinophagaceae bacterium]|nr:hypothetical protein [Chitinophagaceae bacterium]